MIPITLGLYAAGWIAGLTGQPLYGAGFDVLFLLLWLAGCVPAITHRDRAVDGGHVVRVDAERAERPVDLVEAVE